WRSRSSSASPTPPRTVASPSSRPVSAAHLRLSSFLTPRLRRTTAALRVHLYGLDDRAILALKRCPRIDGGVSRVEEVEEPLDPAIALEDEKALVASGGGGG
ncbi:Os01g0854651, partial [Oryza sativa Japonica Group]